MCRIPGQKLVRYAILLLSLAASMAVPARVFAEDDYSFSQGRQHYEMGDFEMAARLFATACERDPKDALAHYFLANSYASLGLHEKASAEYRKTLALDPDSKIGRWSQEVLDIYAEKRHPGAGGLEKTGESSGKSLGQGAASGAGRTEDVANHLAPRTGKRRAGKRTGGEDGSPADSSDGETDRVVSATRHQIEDMSAERRQAAAQSASKLLERAEKESKRLKSESEQAINELPSGRRAGRYRKYMSEQIRSQAKEDSERVLTRAKTQASQISLSAELQARLLEDSATGLESQLIPPTPKGKFGLRLPGTNLYVRQYGY